MTRGGHGSNILNCPFCDRLIDEPREIKTSLGSILTGGKCECGAVYVYDRGGHNLGEAYVDLMAYACNDDWDMAWSLIPDVDYELRELTYDRRQKKFANSQKKITPTYLFVLLKKPIT